MVQKKLAIYGGRRANGSVARELAEREPNWSCMGTTKAVVYDWNDEGQEHSIPTCAGITDDSAQSLVLYWRLLAPNHWLLLLCQCLSRDG